MKKASYSTVQLCLILALGMMLQSFLSSSFLQSTQLQQALHAGGVTIETATPPSIGCLQDKSQTWASTTNNNENDGVSSCSDVMTRIIQRQQCFQLRESPSTSTNIQSSSCASPIKMMPFHSYAAFDGQGFGRIVEHTVLGCIFASVILERPCTIDLDVRDPYWTWRSFLNHGSFDWDWSRLQHGKSDDGSIEQLRLEIEQALAKLPSTGDDQWDAKYFDGNDQANRSQVLPMIWHEGWDVEQHLDYWAHATDSSGTQQRVLLSPSWGNAWNQHVPVPALIMKKTNGHCKLNEMRTHLQNVMFVPTNPTRLLHQQRRDRMFQTSSQTRGLGQPDVQPVYGAIHLRTVLSDANVRRSYLTPQWVRALAECLDKALSLPITPNISHWWLIADNRTVAKYVLDSLPEYHSQVPAILDMDPHIWEKEGTHSGYAMKQKYFHSKLEASMMDFMVLHESQVAVISHGSFGGTGARGNGKVKVQACAPQRSFEIFVARSKTSMMAHA